MDNKELYEKIKKELREELREEIIEAKNEMRITFIGYKQERLHIEKELLYKESMEIEKLIVINDKRYNVHHYESKWTNKLPDEYHSKALSYTMNKLENQKKRKKILDEEKRNSDEIYNLKNNKIPVALPIVDSYYIN